MNRTRSLVLVAVIIALAFSGYRLTNYFLRTYYVRSAETLMSQGHHQDAISSLAKASRVWPNDSFVQYRLATAYRRNGDAEAFRDHLQRAQDLGYPNQIDLDRQKLLLVVQTGDIKSVQKELNQLLIEDLDDDMAEQVYEAKSRGHMTAFEMIEAWTCLTHWLEWRPNSVTARLWRADIASRRGENEHATADLQVALQSDPENKLALMSLGGIYLDTNEVEKAQVHFEKAYALYGDDPNTQFGLANCYFRSGKVTEAEHLAAQVIESEDYEIPRANALMLLGKIYTNRGEPKKAVEVLEKALVIAPRDGNLHQSIGMAYSFLKDRDKAKYYLDKVREIKKLDNRLNDLTTNLMEDPRNVEKRFEVAQILNEMGSNEEAARWLISALRYDPNHIPSHLLLAQFYEKSGHEEEARGHFQIAANLQNSLTQRRPPQQNDFSNSKSDDTKKE